MKIETLRLLVAKGLSAEDILEVAETMDATAGRSAGAERQARYRALGGGKIPEELRAAVFERDEWTCLDCGARDNLCCDHVVPVSKGGVTSFENIQTLCVPCNSRKRDRIRKRDVRRVRGLASDKSTELSEDNADNSSLSRPPNENISNPPTHTHPDHLPGARKGRRLPDGWEPEPLGGETAAIVAAWPAGAIERELARFRDWARGAPGEKGRKADWQATWRNWIRRRDDDGTYRKSADGGQQPPGRQRGDRQPGGEYPRDPLARIAAHAGAVPPAGEW